MRACGRLATMGITIRDAIPGDEPVVQALVFSVLREYGLKPDPDDTDADLGDLQSFYVKRAGTFRIVTDDTGKIVGCGGLLPAGTSDVELRKMYLLPQVRGQGFGEQLLENLIATARAQGHARIVLDTASALKQAIALYRKHGFQPFENPERVRRCDQSYALNLR